MVHRSGDALRRSRTVSCSRIEIGKTGETHVTDLWGESLALYEYQTETQESAETVTLALIAALGFWLGYYVIGELLVIRIVGPALRRWFEKHV